VKAEFETLHLSCRAEVDEPVAVRKRAFADTTVNVQNE